MRKTVRVLTVSPDHEPLWVRLSVQPVGGRWAATLIWAGQRRLPLVHWGTFGEGVS